jgi:fatty acid desaturase
MPQDVPPNDPDLKSSEGAKNARLEQLELEKLEAEAKGLALKNRERTQRIAFRWIAVGLGIVVVIAAGFGMWHVVHKVFLGPFVFASAAFTVSIIVAPILCITTITLTFFVGAFGRFKEKDFDDAKSSVGMMPGKLGLGE